MSPDAIASLIVTKNGDTTDCRQWQRVIATPGKLMQRDDQVYNVTSVLDVYPVERSGNTLQYDRMTLTRVDRLTAECEQAWKKPLPGKACTNAGRAEATFSPRAFNDYSTSSMTQTLTLAPLQVKVPLPSSSVSTAS